MKLAVIPARGGSKRIPRKNIRPFAGRPIIAYSVQTALESGCFDRLVVSTDDPEIASVAREYGAEVPFLRPAALSGDFVGTNAVIRHAIEWFNATGPAVDFACSIYPTAPLLQPAYLRRGFDALIASAKVFAIGVTSFAFPIQRAVRLLSDGTIDAIFPEHRMTRSQDLEPAYHDAGQFLWGRARGFLEDMAPFSTATLAVEIPRHLVVDIDTHEDWDLAELLYRAAQISRRSDRIDPMEVK